MPRSNAALSLVALAALGLATGCEKQSPIVSITAGGVVVKMRAIKYCREDGKCNASKENPLLEIKPGDILGIDVPRSVAEDGWRLGDQGAFSHDHYRSIRLGDQLPSGAPQTISIFRDPARGVGEWQFTLRVK